MQYSMTQAGNLVTIITTVAALIGVTVDPAAVSACLNVGTAVTALGTILVGAAISWYGRYKKGDITLGGFRK